MKTIHRLILTALMAFSTHAFGLGLQMYSLQEDFDLDTPGTLDRLKAQGFTDLETSVFTKLPAAELKALLRARGMTCSSHHVRPETLEKNMDQVIADAKALGAVQVVCPILPHKAPLDRAQVLKAAANFNRYGAALKAVGLRFAYHNHGGDFQPTDSPSASGETFYDVLIAATEPGVVSFQLDVFWVAWGGAKAADVIEKHGQRICSLHLKDLAKDTKPDLTNPKSARSFMVRLAAGRVDIPAVIAAAKAKGISHFIIEDESPNAAEQLPESLKAVKPQVEGTSGPISAAYSAEPSVVLEETFEQPLSADWHWGLGTWTAKDGVLRGFESGERRHGPVKVHKLTMTDAVIECEFRLIGKALFAGIILNGAQERGHIVHLVMGKDHLRVLAHPKKGESVELLKQDNPLTIDEWHRVRLELKGDTLTATIDKTRITAIARCIADQKLSFGLGGESGGPEGEKAGALEFRGLKITTTP
jgi:sugar phosphate isomerase/epimerase